MLNCAPFDEVYCDERSDPYKEYLVDHAKDARVSEPICGSIAAYPYFITFYALCSFLVSWPLVTQLKTSEKIAIHD